MSDQANSGQGQAPAAGSPGQGQAPAGQQDQQQQQAAPGQAPEGGQQQQGTGQFDLSTIQDPALRAYLEKMAGETERARQEAARYRTERATLQEQVQQFQRQNETDQERQQREAAEAQQRLERLESENRDLKVGAAFRDAASAAKAFSPTAVWDLVKARGIQVEVDDQGKPTNTAAILAGLQQSDPYLFPRTPQGADGGGAGGGQAPGATGGINDLIRGRGRTVAR